MMPLVVIKTNAIRFGAFKKKSDLSTALFRAERANVSEPHGLETSESDMRRRET